MTARHGRPVALAALVCGALVVLPPAAGAQPRTPVTRPAAESTVRVRGVVEAGGRTFTASESFDAVLGSHAGPLFGAGADVLVGRTLFVSFGVSRFQKDGERVVVAGGEAFPNGIATTISIVPIEVSAGWRFAKPGRTVIPYLGGGVGWHRYKETSDFAAADEDASSRRTGFQLLGGAEWRASRWLGVAGEAVWMSVPNAFPGGATSAAGVLGEDDLGGAVFRVKVLIGR
jgi:opacity protein-like surface antigen